MSILSKLKKLPDDNKKIFAGSLALILTILIILFWVAFGPEKKDNSQDIKNVLDDMQIDSFKESVQKSIDDFNTAKEQLWGTISTSTVSTTTATTTNQN